MNYVKDGTAYPHGIFWSDLKKPLSVIESEDSVAGSLELDSGETILAALELGNVLLVYTTLAIWEIAFTNGDGSQDNPIFAAARRYKSEKGEACLAYKNTLISKGDEHLFAARDGIHSFSLFQSKPVLVEWIHRASSFIYDTLDKSMCDWFIAKYNPDRREVYYSWVNTGDELPTHSLVINTEFPFSGIIDHGFTAFEMFQPNEPVQTLADWILEQCICDSEEYAEVFGEPENEGGPCEEPEAVVCEDQPDSFYTTVTQELEDDIVMEDWNEAEPSENSLCNRLAGTTISSLCVDEARRDQCNAGRYFVMASADDFCLKQLSDGFYRQVCTGFTGCGTYQTVGYKSILRSGPLAFRDVANEKKLARFLVEAIAATAVVPGQMAVRFGFSSMALDPNQTDCGIVWVTEDPIRLDCVAVATEDHEDDNTRPDGDLSWPTLAIGQFLYYEITVENPDSDPEDTGASVCMSSYVVEVEAVQRRY